MRTTILAIAISLGLSAAVAAAATRYVEGEVIVTFRGSATLAAAQQDVRARSLTLARHFPGLSQQRKRQTALVRGRGQTTAALITELQHDPAVETVEPNYLRWVSAATPDDTFFPEMWALQNTGQSVDGVAGTSGADIRFRTAWDLARASTGDIVVAVIDTGVDYTHPDLAANMWINPGEIAGNGIDDDGNACVDDVHGFNFVANNANPIDASDHGTHVAGTIAAVGRNALGVIGVAYNARIMALRVSADGSTIDTASVIEALQYVTLMKGRGVGIVAVNASFGGGGYSTSERSAIQAAGDAGVIFCAAAGNDAANNDATSVYPASYRLTNMIVVAASDQNDALAGFSNYGITTVDLAAPGVNVFSTRPTYMTDTAAEVKRGATTYPSTGLTYAGASTGITAAIYDCGLGYPTNFPPAVSNNIALIQRGTLYFSEKVGYAMAAGARAVVIDNNVAGNFLGTLQSPSNWIPAVSISMADGAELRAALPATGTVINALTPTSLYHYLDGTSMATPHVAGAVAFAALSFPGEGVTQRIQRVLTAADARSGLSGKVRTGGRLNLARIVDANANAVPDWWEQSYLGQLGLDIEADADHDGMSSYAEFIAGTDPHDALSYLRAINTVPTAGGYQVTWTSVPGKHYRVWYAHDLLSPWSVAQSNIAAAAGATTTWSDGTAGGVTQRYYHVQVVPAE